MKAWYKDEFEVTIIEKNGGWTTVEFQDGMQRKVRNGDLREILDEKVEYTLAEALAEEKTRKCVNTTYNPDHYVKAKSINGHATLHNGDEFALQLAEMTLMEIYSYASLRLGVSVDDLQTKYGHLNKGMQRMNLGNRLRAWYKKQS
jgi:hypothetical protein